jgi:isocitrate lyase
VVGPQHGFTASQPASQAARRGRRNQEGVISMSAIGEQAALLQHEWDTRPRWAGITRHYSAQHVIRLRGGGEEHSAARRAASRLWDLLNRPDGVRAVGVVTGSQAVQAASAGWPAICQPGWQAADGSPAGRLAPVVVGAEAGVEGAPDAFELMKAVIEAGAAGVRFDDQLPAGGKRAYPGQQVLIPTAAHIEALTAARLAADALGVPSLVIARTGARAASLLTSDIDERDHEFLTGERTLDGLHRMEPGLYACGTRALAFAPYADLLWLETPAPDLAAARAFACVIHSQYPGKLLAYSCSPSYGRRAQLDDASIARFQRELAAMGYRFQVTIPAGSRTLDEPAPYLAARPAHDGEPAYAQS